MNMSLLGAINSMNMYIYIETAQQTKWNETLKSQQIKILRDLTRSGVKGKARSSNTRRLMGTDKKAKMVSRS